MLHHGDSGLGHCGEFVDSRRVSEKDTNHTSPDSVVSANLMPFFICICELFNGILQPRTQMPVFWEYTMYYITPFTYWVGGILSSILQGTPVQCEENELAVFQSPPNMTCIEYAGPWLSEKGRGYMSNPDDQVLCGYCAYSYGDDVSN